MNVSTALEVEQQHSLHPRRRWSYLQKLIQDVWSRWLTELVPQWNVRKRWKVDERAVAPGDVLLVKTKDTPRGKWPIRRVLEVFPGPDNVVRVVNIQIG